MSEQDKTTTVTQKVAEVACELERGEELDTSEIAERYSMTFSGAWRMLDRMSTKIPIVVENNKWRKV